MYLGHIWQSLAQAATPGASKRINPDSPLAQYCGLNGVLKPTFFTITDQEPKQLPDLKVLKSIKASRGDGSWISGLELLDEEFLKEFDYLCSELVRAASLAIDESNGLELQKRAFEEWLEFFKRDRSFSEEIARGLFGELKFMQESRIEGELWGEILNSWMGPFGGHQDFVFSGFKAREIKTLQPSSTEIVISSEHQLDFLGPLYLVLYRLQELGPSHKGESLVDVVKDIELDLTSAERADFRRGLAAVGFDPANKIANDAKYAIGEKKIYEVLGEDFPRIRSTKVSHGVRRVQYRIDLASLSGFEVSNFED